MNPEPNPKVEGFLDIVRLWGILIMVIIVIVKVRVLVKLVLATLVILRGEFLFRAVGVTPLSRVTGAAV
eukprot:8526455-Karenia_brevis.AAC.1